MINSLLEKNILPSSVTPVIALIMIVEYNEKPGAKICFIDRETKDIEMNLVEEYVTEDKNPDNRPTFEDALWKQICRSAA